MKKNSDTSFSERNSLSITTQLENVQEEIKQLLKEMQTNVGKSVFELSCDHKVVCIFIKWIGCPL
jgi:hypothetical protein